MANGIFDGWNILDKLTVPEPELVEISQLKVDGQNPNRMTPKQLDALKKSITRWGFIVPIITNKDLMIADGEQRLTAARELGINKLSVIRLPVEDVARALRQVLNKLKGTHQELEDAYEFQRIIMAGQEDNLKQLLQLSDAQIERYLNLIREPKAEDYEIPEIDKIKTEIKRGDIYQLGQHRLMCGDATSRRDVEALMNDAKANTTNELVSISI